MSDDTSNSTKNDTKVQSNVNKENRRTRRVAAYLTSHGTTKRGKQGNRLNLSPNHWYLRVINSMKQNKVVVDKVVSGALDKHLK